ncbi:MAG TPA: hypothetical protein VNP20_11145 [Nocardioidaceae bacterium]|nr:hypothetical protein [Nocardioidaceae bacterium]
MADERNRISGEQDESYAGGESVSPGRRGQSRLGEPGGIDIWISQYEWAAAARDIAAHEREQVAAGRDSAAATRADAAEIRSKAAATRRTAAGTRAQAAWLRTHPTRGGLRGPDQESGDAERVDALLGKGNREDRAADERDRAANGSDRADAQRERTAERHDFDRLVWIAGDDLWEKLIRVLLERADRRDHLAERRDRAAEQREQLAGCRGYAADNAHRDRMASAVDRDNSARDRDDAAGDRAELIDAVRDLVSLARRDDQER